MAKQFGIFVSIIVGIILMIVGIFVLCLYVVPGFKPFGMDAVYQKSKYTTYLGNEIDELFKERNFIIESENTEIEIRIRKIDYEDQGRIQVFEDANGIAFNSLDRTLIDFEYYIDPNDSLGIPYTKIIVREPSGVMKRTARVKINLEVGSDALYNFILNTGMSNVYFSHDTAVEYMKIDTLEINGTGRVYMTEPTSVSRFNMDIGRVTINSPDSFLYCKYKITGVCEVNGNSRNIELGEVGGIKVNSSETSGDLNMLKADKVNGNVDFYSKTGTINIKECLSQLYIRSVNVKVQVEKAGSVDVVTTESAASSVVASTININSVTGNSDVRMHSGTLNLGSKTNGLGIFGNVFAENKNGKTNIIYAAVGATGTCTVRATDGTVDIYGVRAKVDVFVASAGNANVNVTFAEIAAGNQILVDGAREPNDRYGNYVNGNVTITLIGELSCSLRLWGTSEAFDKIPPRTGSKDDHISNTQYETTGENEFPAYDIHGGGSDILIKTQSRFEIGQRAAY